MPDRVIEVGVERLHLEQDAGKSIHDLSPRLSFVDLNRAGIALMEIVSRPHLRDGEEAAAYLKKLRTILRYLGTCDGNMEQGSMRADVNVSVCKVGGYERFRSTGDFKHLGTRCEIKNVNSIRFVADAVAYEARRQVDVLEGGGKIRQETRLFESKTGETRSMRSKEEAHDLQIFSRPRSSAVGARRRLGGRDQAHAARTSGRKKSALHIGVRTVGLRRERPCAGAR